MKYRTMNQGVATTCATCGDTRIACIAIDAEHDDWEDCPDCAGWADPCGTEDNPHQWAQVPHPDDTCGRCQRAYKACGTAWHEVGR